MNISNEQIAAAEQGETIRLTAGTELVLVRADLYDKVSRLLDDPSQTYAAVIEALDDKDPDQYLEYLDEPQ